MKEVLGCSEATWQELNLPRMESNDLDHNSAVYTDCFIAQEIFHMRYKDYIQTVSRTERLFYQIFLALKALKDRRAMERAQQQADAERVAHEALSPPGSRL